LQCTYDQLTRVTGGQYLVPASDTFEAIDAVYLPYMLQMTVAEDHPIKMKKFAEYLITLDERVIAGGKAKDTVYQEEIPFVFVVPLEKMDSFK